MSLALFGPRSDKDVVAVKWALSSKGKLHSSSAEKRNTNFSILRKYLISYLHEMIIYSILHCFLGQYKIFLFKIRVVQISISFPSIFDHFENISK